MSILLSNLKIKFQEKKRHRMACTGLKLPLIAMNDVVEEEEECEATTNGFLFSQTLA